jgi:acetylornithine deacetylase/succinyl-diaminopimelate desuccinylase-like protein
VLADAGFDPVVLAEVEGRPNVVVRLPGRGEAPGLLVHGHVDVVTTQGQAWTHPPFDADLADGMIWGRGTLDMKGGVAMLVSALLRLKAEGVRPAGDIVLAVLSDEEAGSDHGARFLVERHPEVLDGVRYSIGEGGGASHEMEGRRLYHLAVAEKRVCWMHAVLHGQGGHGSSPVFGGVMSRLRHLLEALDSRWLPVHVTPVARMQVEAMAAALPEPAASHLRALLDPGRTDQTLSDLGDIAVRGLGPLLHNTVSVTTLGAGEKVNVIPGQVDLDLDGRLLPGFSSDDLLAEIGAVLGQGAMEDLELTVSRTEPPTDAEPDLGLMSTLTGVLRELDPEGVPVPSMVSGFTDGRLFSRLGIQNYGALLTRNPSGWEGGRLAHAGDERIPVESLEFGAEAMYRVMARYSA